MILVADSGSTKTEWKVLRGDMEEESVFSSGINPFFLSSEDIYLLLKKELGSYSGYRFDTIYFYGTGCNSEAKNSTVKNALGRFFSSYEILIGTDLLGAARSLCQNSPGIACIMGTGSNSCYFDGNRIVSNVAPLGYILGDEGGGAVIGRKLISAVLKKQVPQPVIDLFIDTYKITPAEILESVYMKPFPNRFLGQFAKFISSNIHIPELQEIITTSFEEFIKRNVLQYTEAGILPIHFTGSIAIHFRGFLEESLRRHSLNPGIFTLSPMENLIRYHIQNLNPGIK
jgi:N-acetylglucosamine kinase-like BadF-type ATPase